MCEKCVISGQHTYYVLHNFIDYVIHWELIKCLKKEADSSDANIVRMELNLEGVKLKKKY